MANETVRDPLDLYPITREQFELIENELPVARRHLIPTYVFVNAIVYFLYHLTSWRTLEGRYEVVDGDGVVHPVKWNTVYRRHRYWVRIGVWEHVMALIQEVVHPDRIGFAALDSTSIKLAPSAYNSKDDTIGVSRGGRNVKLHALVSNDGVPFLIWATGGQRNDGRAAQEKLQTVDISRISHIACDKAYTAKALRGMFLGQGVEPVIPPKRNTRDPWEWDRELYKRRGIVENFFGRLKRNRHLSARFDRLPEMFLSFVHLAIVVNFLTCDYTPVEGRWRKN